MMSHMMAQSAAAASAATRGGGGGGDKHKMQPFSSGDGPEWMDWLRTFRVAMTINNWTPQRSAQSLIANLAGEAAAMARHIHLEDYATLEELISALTGCYVTPADSAYARAQFKICGQRQDETLLKFSVRIKNLYAQAYPGLPAETSRDLIDHYLQGLLNSTVAEKVAERLPSTFSEAVQAVQNSVAATAQFKAGRTRYLRTAGTGADKINMLTGVFNEQEQKVAAMDKGGNKTKKPQGQQQQRKPGPRKDKSKIRCFHCDREGHYRSECPQLQGQPQQPRAGNGRFSKGKINAVTEEGEREKAHDAEEEWVSLDKPGNC